MIQVDDLTKYYNDFCAVDHISLEIPKGEIMGLLGPNGAGKTTTLRMLTGYFKPTSGRIRIKDHDVDEQPVTVKGLIGYLPESAPLYPGMMAYDYLSYIADIRGLRGEAKLERLRDLADRCGLHEIMHKTIGELSKGLKQRVGLAHAMMSDPEILILDEPTSGLDPNQIVEIRDIIRAIGQEKTVILSTHILSEAEATCDRIVIINKGRIVADDRTANLKNSADGARQIQLSLQNADEAAVSGALGAIDGVADVSTRSIAEGKGVDVTLACRHGSDPRAAIYKVVKQTDWVLLEFVQQSRDLESIFRELTKEN